VPETAAPLVSVVVPTRDRVELLQIAVARVLEQTYRGEIECIVVHDQCEAPDLDVEVPPGRSLRVLPNGRSPGLAGARNTGVLASRGELIAFCDDDDEWLPQKLELEAAALLADPAAAAVVCGVFVCYRGRETPRVPGRPVLTLRDLLQTRQIMANPCTVLVWRDRFIHEIGLVDEQIPGSYSEDYEWLLRVAAVAPIVAVQQPLILQRFHSTSFFQGRWEVMIEALKYLLEKHPEIATEPRGLARIYGRLAFASAAAGQHRKSRAWARRCLAANWREPRAYIALLVSFGLLRPSAILHVAHLKGRGI